MAKYRPHNEAYLKACRLMTASESNPNGLLTKHHLFKITRDFKGEPYAAAEFVESLIPGNLVEQKIVNPAYKVEYYGPNEPSDEVEYTSVEDAQKKVREIQRAKRKVVKVQPVAFPDLERLRQQLEAEADARPFQHVETEEGVPVRDGKPVRRGRGSRKPAVIEIEDEDPDLDDGEDIEVDE